MNITVLPESIAIIGGGYIAAEYGHFLSGTERYFKTTVSVVANEILIATGRGPNTDILHPEKGGIKIDDRGWIVVNEYLETSQPDIWAFGDADGKYLFKHVANYESQIVYYNAILREKKAIEQYGEKNVVIVFQKYINKSTVKLISNKIQFHSGVREPYVSIKMVFIV